VRNQITLLTLYPYTEKQPHSTNSKTLLKLAKKNIKKPQLFIRITFNIAQQRDLANKTEVFLYLQVDRKN